MDPISQGVVGAAFAQTAARRTQLATVAWYGGLGGLAPDLDVLFQSPSDPLVFLEYHRQFTHSLVFIPVGAFLVFLVLRAIASRLALLQGLTAFQGYLACLMGYATHGLLDACTSYGTQLFWPFSEARIAWDSMPIVDPFFTVPVLVLVIAASRCKRKWLNWCACAWMLCFFVAGGWQHHRAIEAAEQLARNRGHEPTRLTAKPSVANLVLWKTIYEYDGHYYVDAVRVGTQRLWYPGTRVAKLDLPTDFPGLQPDSVQARDVERFRWFSDGYLTVEEPAPRIGDLRYSFLPNEVDPMWGIELDLNDQDEHVAWWASRRTDDRIRRQFVRMVLGLDGIPLDDDQATPP